MDSDLLSAGRERALLLLLALGSLLLSLPYVWCLGDDTFIYMRVIANYLASGQIEYNPGEPAYLVTSPTWFYLWTAATRLLGDVDAARYLLSALFHGLAIFTTWLVARRIVVNPYLRLLVLAAAFFDPFYLRWMWAGWETGMKIFMASLALWSLLRLVDAPRIRDTFLAGILVGLAFLTRPEMIVLVGLGLLYIPIRFPSQRSLLLPFGVGVLISSVPWMVHAYLQFGWALPHTIFVMSGADANFQYLLQNALKFAKVIGGPLVVVFAVLALGVIHRARSRGRKPGFGPLGSGAFLDWALVATWGVAVTGYLITGSYIASIYTGLFIPALAVAVAGLTERLSPGWAAVWLTRRRSAGLIALTVLVSIGIQSQLYFHYSFFNPQYRSGADAHFIEFAKQIRELTEPDAEVGLWELGVIGYFSERYIVDFQGLATPDIVTYRRLYPGEYGERFLADRGHAPDYIVSHYPKGIDEGRDSAPREFFGFDYEPMLSSRVQRIGGSVPRDHYDLYVLYRLAN